jgi:UDP-N-acetylmuramate--alanine ligase
MNVKKNIYFIGIGGIGMSAFARFFHAKGHHVAGYDKSDSHLIRELMAEGIEVILEDKIDLLPAYLNPSDTLVIRTPAVPLDAVILSHVKEAGFELIKRSELLAIVSQGMRSIAVAGTHGKTTTSSMIAHILTHSGFGCNAFIGGVMTGYNTNVLIDAASKFMVLEADEFDRSFHHLKPELAVITSLDPDHLDIYETEENFSLAFQTFAGGVQSAGTLFCHDAIPFFPISTNQRSYGLDDAVFKACNIQINDGAYHFDLIHPKGKVNDLVLHMPGRHNVTNATAACAVALSLEIPDVKIRQALDAYEGVQRRFQFHQRGPVVQLIDDYAHHPSEIRASINAARELFPDKKLTVAFQPHLFTRTRDFLDGFADSLSLADEVVLVPIYPAREKPIPGVTSEEILKRMSLTNKILCTKEELPTHFATRELEVLLILGAGDIDRTIPLINSVLSKRNLGQ